jgi:hypothetical protein
MSVQVISREHHALERAELNQSCPKNRLPPLDETLVKIFKTQNIQSIDHSNIHGSIKNYLRENNCTPQQLQLSLQNAPTDVKLYQNIQDAVKRMIKKDKLKAELEDCKRNLECFRHERGELKQEVSHLKRENDQLAHNLLFSGTSYYY